MVTAASLAIPFSFARTRPPYSLSRNPRPPIASNDRAPLLTHCSLLDLGSEQPRRMGDGGLDVNSISEEEFDQRLAVYLVPDPTFDESSSKPRAEATLPRNLVLKPTQAHGQPNNVSTTTPNRPSLSFSSSSFCVALLLFLCARGRVVVQSLSCPPISVIR